MKLLIIQTGSTRSAEIKASSGDYDRMFLDALGLQSEQAQVVRVHQGEPLPQPAGLSGAVVTGSSTMVTDREPWSERTAVWLRAAAGSGLPILGVCYGHQLLAHALGGRVSANRRGPEYGQTRVEPVSEAAADPLFSVMARGGEDVFQAHYQSIERLPAGAAVMARNAADDYQAARFGKSVWGVQFHPEFSAPVIRAVLDKERDSLIKEGLDVDARRAAVDTRPEVFGRRLLRRFHEICGG